MRQLEMEHLGDMLDEARDEVVRTGHIKGDMRARMFAEAMTNTRCTWCTKTKTSWTSALPMCT